VNEYANPAISPDGNRIAVAVGPVASRDIWILDGAGGAASRFTFTSNNDSPVWSPDGKNIAFSSSPPGQVGVYLKPADGSAPEKLVFKATTMANPTSWTKDGRFVSLHMSTGDSRNQALLLTEAELKAVPMLRDEPRVVGSRLAWDGRWIAYSTE